MSKYKNLDNAFKALREKDYLAERKFACCVSCAIHNLPDEKASLFVITTANDESDLKKTGECFVAWGAPEDSSKELVRILNAHGVVATHDGNPNKKIKIKIN